MSKKLIFLLVLLLIKINISAQEKETIIEGKIIGKIPEKIEYTTPIKGTWFYGSKKSVRPDSLGNFQISINVETPSFVTLYIPKKVNGTLIIEKGKTYKVSFNLNSKDKNFTVLGETSKAHNIYNSFPNPDFNVFGGKELLKDSVTLEISSKIKIAKDKELLLFEELFDKGDISKDFLFLVRLDRECYYLSLQGRVASYKFGESFRANNDKLKTSSVKLWDDVYKKMPMDTPMLYRSPWFYALANNFIEYQDLKNEAFEAQKLIKKYNPKEIH